MTGDALLHLIPHAFIEHSSNEKKLKSYDFLDDIKLKTEHDDSHVNVYKGLGAFIGIYVFFIIEKLVRIRQDYNEKKIKKTSNNNNNNNNNNEYIGRPCRCPQVLLLLLLLLIHILLRLTILYLYLFTDNLTDTSTDTFTRF